jgi:hypothetical protein
MTSGRTKIVFLSIAIGIFLFGASSVAKAATAYMATGGGAFGTIDLNTGVFTQLGLTTNVPVVGLALVGTTLYADGQGTGNNHGQLYSVNPATGALMSIGSPTGINFTAFGSYGGTLYALDYSSANANLYSINSSTGGATLIGPTNTGQPLAGYWALSTNSTALYFSLNSNLYTLNTSTGQATVVGGLGGSIQVGAIAEVGGVLYAGQDSPQPPLKIVSLNKSTGAATAFSNVTNSPGSNASYISGLAPTINFSQNYYFSHLAFGGGFQTTLTLINYSPQAITCTTNFYSDAGAALSVPFGQGSISTRTDVLPAGGSIHDQTIASLSAAVTEGWAQSSCTGPVQANLLYRYYVNGVAASEAGVNAETAPTTEFATFAQTATGVAYANPSTSQSAIITFTVYDTTGATLGGRIVTLGPMQHSSANLGPLLGLSSFTGFVKITSTIPIISLSLNAEAFPVISSLPPGDLPSTTTLVP